MGCVQAKPSMHSPPSGLNKMKTENGYVGRSGIHGRPPKQRYSGKEPARISRHERRNDAAGAAATSIDVRSEDGRVLTREGGKEGGGLSQRMSSSRQSSGGEEIVDGWPKWLTDNIPREALVGLVPKSAESYDKLDKIGQGTYSNVYKARDRDTGKIVALKKVRFDTSESESVRFMAREIMILRKLDHPNVVKLEGLATSRMQYSLYLVFDFMQTDLARIISRPDGYLTEPQVKCYMQQLLLGLQHCHGRGILHRDIKGSNLLIDKNGMLKIADFGLANYFNPNQKRPLTSRVVTLWYRAPELLLGATDYGVGIDLWSAGCLLAEMFAGRPIMPGRTEVEQLHRIFKLCGSPSEDYWKKLKLSTSFRPPQPYKPSIVETFRDFPTSSLGLLTMLLALDPAYRGNASSALQSEFFSTSPLACGLSGLPVIYKEEENESTNTYERRRHRTSKQKRRPRNKGTAAVNPKGDSSSSKEEKEKSPTASMHSQEMGSSTGSTSSGVKLGILDGSPAPSLSPIISSLPKRPSHQTECHPWAGKNIQNPPPLLTSSKIKNAGDKEGLLVGRSASTSDLKGRISALNAFND
ncbi:probable serine/threonine-protein kinase At1g54610 isoform X1 [Magnolia sinica]|uniref:probable serine/threonine-protein kinase At1g54610 isoform X1 n=1 Tax=Magnolia sinica TaxID=86752 RepID=UPI0026593C8F|nr:probable serine/threonine-protein kinase At1g54610 isoform X1 [Magnolia sinica]